MNIRNVLTVAGFESRLVRRQIRVWVLGLVVLLAAAIGVAQTAWIWFMGSGWSGSFATMTPDMIIFRGVVFGALSTAVLGVFFAFDWRHRDVTARFSQTYDHSVTQLEYCWGKFLATLRALLWPYVICLIATIVTMVALGASGPWQVYVYSYFFIAPILGLIPIAITFGLAGLTGNRAVAILGGLAWCVVTWACMGIFNGLDIDIPEPVALVLSGGAVGTGLPLYSAFVGYDFSLLDWGQILSAVGLVLFMVCLAAWGRFAPGASPASGRNRLFATVGSLAIYLIGVSVLLLEYRRGTTQREAVVAAETKALDASVPSVLNRDVELDLTETGSLSGTARLRLRNDESTAMDRLVFRLNHGLEVSGVTADGQSLSHEQDWSVLTVTPSTPLQTGDELELEFTYAGGIEKESVDAETELALRGISTGERQVRRFFGVNPTFLRGSVVVLGLDAGFHPEPDFMFGHEPPSRPFRRLAPGRLSLKLPEGWTAASAGAHTVEADGSHLFVAEHPIPGFSVNAGPYLERNARVKDIDLRFLFHPDHEEQVAFFDEAGEKLLETIEERFDEAEAQTGLSYPLPVLSVVEVPQTLASFSASWDAPNRLGAPGVVMLKEGGFFQANFEFPLKTLRDNHEESTGAGDDAAEFDVAQTKADLAQRFMSTDWTGGNLERLAYKTCFDFQAQAVGEAVPVAGLALSSQLAENAIKMPVIDSPETARIYQKGGEVFQRLGRAMSRGQTNRIPDIVMNALVDEDKVYQTMLTKPLEQLDPRDDQSTYLGVLYRKGRLPWTSLRETLGRQNFAACMRTLVDDARERGGQFEWDDVRRELLAVAKEEDKKGLVGLLDNWSTGTGLPGYVVNNVRLHRLAGEDERYQFTANVANRGDVAGSTVVRVRTFDGGLQGGSVTLHLEAGEEVEVGLLTDYQPTSWNLATFLSLNRQAPSGELILEEDELSGDGFQGQRPATNESKLLVVVDNLDEGFTLTHEGQSIPFMAPGAEEGEFELERARWLRRRGFKSWTRWRTSWGKFTAFGVFDATAAVKAVTQEGNAPARWQAVLPEPGLYRVEAFLPGSAEKLQSATLADSYHFELETADGAEPIVLERDSTTMGWNDLGRYRLGRDTTVTLQDLGEAGLIYADAVRFSREPS
ncbi:MAG: hypothetical protein AAF533_04755 [Acidobacteriota bacterium]